MRRTLVAPATFSALCVLSAPISRMWRGGVVRFGVDEEGEEIEDEDEDEEGEEAPGFVDRSPAVLAARLRRSISERSHSTSTRLESPPRLALWPTVLASWYVLRPPAAASCASRSWIWAVSLPARARVSRFCSTWCARMMLRVCLDDCECDCD